MRYKPGVDVNRVLEQLSYAAVIYDYARQAAGWGEGTITSGTDGSHSATSKHYEGKALDLRTNDLPGGSLGQAVYWLAGIMRQFLDMVATYLGIPSFVVLVEDDHIHVHWTG